MDSIFGIGPLELVVILVIAGIVMGPERIGKFARWFGRITAQLQTVSRGFVRQLQTEIDTVDEGGDLSGALRDMQALRKQFDELKEELTAGATSILSDGQKAVRETKDVVEHSIRPPSLGAEKTAETSSDGQNGRDPQVASSDEDAPANTASPPKLPKRIDVPDDPE